MKATSKYFNHYCPMRLADIKGAWMKSYNTEPFNGKHKLIIFDWLGTLTNDSSIYAANRFKQVFAKNGLFITMNQARKPMGLPKLDHIKKIFDIPPLILDYKPNDQFCRKLLNDYNDNVTIDKEVELLPEVETMFDILRASNYKLMLTSGFDTKVMDAFKPLTQKLKFDSTCCSDEVAEGQSRPNSGMILKNLSNYYFGEKKYIGETVVEENKENLELLFKDENPLIIKVGDTLADIEEGKNFTLNDTLKTWTIAVSGTSSYLNVDSYNELKNLSYYEWCERELSSARKLFQARPNFIIPSVLYLPETIKYIEYLHKNNYSRDRYYGLHNFKA